MTLDDILIEIRERPVILAFGRGRVVPAFPVPWQVRQAIRKYNSQLHHLMMFSDYRVCPSPGLHRASWYHAGSKCYRCKICQQTLASVLACA